MFKRETVGCLRCLEMPYVKILFIREKHCKICAQFVVALIDHHGKKGLCLTNVSTQFIEIAHMDEGTCNFSPFLAWLNVFHMLWDRKKKKEREKMQGGQNSFQINKLRKGISSFFLLMLLKTKILLQLYIII